MSATVSIYRTWKAPVPFTPSIAIAIHPNQRANPAVRSLQFLGQSGIAFVSSIARPMTGWLQAAGAMPQASEATSQELVSALVAKGMPVAALSEILHVERKTVYSWLDEGRDAKQDNHERLKAIHALLSAEQDGSLRFFHRFWNRELAEVGSLKCQLTGSIIDAQAVKTALAALRPAVERAMAADVLRKSNTKAQSPAGSLTLLLQATT